MALNYDKKILLISFFVVITAVIALHQYKIVNLIFLLFCTILLLYDRKLLILIYIIILPTNGFIGTEYNLFNILHVSYIVNFITSLALMLEWNSLRNILKKQKKSSLNRYIYWLIIFFLFYIVFTDIRLKILGIETTSYRLLFTRTIRRISMLLPLIILNRLCLVKNYGITIRRGFIISVGLISLSIIFSRQLAFIGFSTQESSFFTYYNPLGFVRRAGIFTLLGDENSAAGFLAIGLSYILYNKKELLSTLSRRILLIIILLAVIATGSRIGLVCSILILLIFFSTGKINSRQRILAIVLSSLFLIFIFSTNYISPVLDRFSELQIGEGHLDPSKEFGRLGGWLFYTKYIISNIQVLLLGSSRSIYDAVGWSNVYLRRVAHNFFIQLWYLWGIIPLIILIKLLVVFYKNFIKQDNKFLYISLLLPLFMTLFFVSDPAIFLGFIVPLITIQDVK